VPNHPARAAVALGLVLVLGTTAAVAGAFSPGAFLPPADSVIADSLPDARELDRIDGTPASLRSTLTAALHRWPQHYNAGLLGVDGLLNPTGARSGASAATYVITRAQAAQWDPSYDEDERGQILAFSHGLVRAAQRTDASAPGELVADAASVPIDAPTAFLYDAFFDPHHPLPVDTCGDGRNGESEASGPAYDAVADDGCPGGVGSVGRAEPRRGYLVDYFLDLRADLEVVRERIRLDREYIDASNGVTVRRSKPLDTVRGLRFASVDIEVCAGARDICLRDVEGDSAEDGRLWVAEQYATDWIAAIDEGLTRFGDLGVAITRGLYDPQVMRHARIAECGTSPSGIVVNPRSGCETKIEVVDAVLWASESFTTGHLLGMLGEPSALNMSPEALDEFAGLFEGLVDPFVSPVRDGRHTLVTLAQAKIERAMQPVLAPVTAP
jgi:hypothetical protein